KPTENRAQAGIALSSASSRARRREAGDRCRREYAAGSEHGRREALFVDRIREVLGLQGDPTSEPVGLTTRADQASVQLVPCVELHPGLGRPNVEPAVAHRLFEASGVYQGAPGGTLQHEVVVVSARPADLLELAV